MPVARPILLNNTSFTPSDIKESEERVGTSWRAANGRRRLALRGVKRAWAIEWAKVLLATLEQVRAVYRMTTDFTYVSESGEFVTVFCDTDALQVSRPFIAGDGTVYYQVTLTIKEA